LGGNIQSVRANIANYSLPDVIEVEDTVSAYLCYANGATGIFFATNAYGSHKAPDIELVFENGTARYMDDTLWLNGEIICKDTISNAEKAYYGLGHTAMARRYYDNHEFFNIYDVQNTMETVFAIYESARKHNPELF